MLTVRQRLLLKSIIEEFIHSAQAVGSLNISDKYDLQVSPATIRNEMAHLAELGLLGKTHASSGRVPTTRALKWFLDEVLDTYEEIDPFTAATVREQMFQNRFNADRLLDDSIRSLHKLTGNTVVATLGDKRYISGLSTFLDQPEYADVQRLKKILNLLEDYAVMHDMFTQYDRVSTVKVLIGEETGIDQFYDSAVAFAAIKLHGEAEGYISVVGPNRMNYARVIPAIKYIVQSIQDVVQGW